MKSLRHAVALLVPALLAFGAAVAALLVFGTARRVVSVGKRVPDVVIRSVDTGAQTIELQRTLDTELPGRYGLFTTCLLYTSPSPRDRTRSRMPSSA